MHDSEMGGMTTEAAGAIQQRWPVAPRVGLILGTGLGDLADTITAEEIIEYDQVPHFPRSTALGHRGRLVCGMYQQVPVIAMQGRCHLYEGYHWEQVTLPVRILRALGVQVLVITNASGGLNPGFRAGEIMVMDDHMDLTFRSPHGWHPAATGSGQGPMRADRVPRVIYDDAICKMALAAARTLGVVAHRGTYVALTGPTYETRAEYRMLRTLGGDAVGMSTVPEAIMASHLGMRMLALSIVTNVATPDALGTVSGEEVVAAAGAAGSRVQEILSVLVPQLDRLAAA